MTILQSAKIAGSREKVLRAATALFAAKGFHETSMRDVARRARVNEVTIFRLFRNKQDLYLSVLEGKMGSDVPRWLDPVLNTAGDHKTVFLAVAERLQQLFDPVFLRLLFFAALEKPEILKRRFRPRLVCFYEVLGDHIQAQIDNGVLRSLQPSFMGRALVAMIAYQELFCEFLGGRDFPGCDARESVRAYTDIWLHGCSAQASESDGASRLPTRRAS